MYTIASDGRQRIAGKNLFGRGMVIPTGTIHAVAPEAETTACGKPVSRLFVFGDNPWANVPGVARCDACQAAVSDQSHPTHAVRL